MRLESTIGLLLASVNGQCLMAQSAVSVTGAWKSFRLYHEKNQHLKTALLRGRRAQYEEFWALKGIDFEVKHGESFGIIGSNGSGKSTLLKCLAGILTPDKGWITHNGRVVALLELGAGFHPELSGRENVYLNGAILGMTRSDIDRSFDDIVEFSGLEKFIDTPVKNYSSGMVVRLGFAIATNVNPEILVIDEVLAVGDASFQQRCYERIESFRQDGRTIILVSHGLAQITQLCSRAAWIEKGDLKDVGPALEIVSAYTGNSYNAIAKTEGQIGERWGEGGAEITAIRILDGEQHERQTHLSGRPLTISIDIDAHTPIEEPVVGLRITDIHGNPIFGTNTRRRAFKIGRIFGPSTVNFEIPVLTLLEGTYDLTIALSDMSEVREYDHWDRKVRFNVHQFATFDEGIVAIDGSWTKTTS
jgi:ABC-type polysaccharide/polyol phosphate transport system ATPase subunit